MLPRMPMCVHSATWWTWGISVPQQASRTGTGTGAQVSAGVTRRLPLARTGSSSSDSRAYTMQQSSTILVCYICIAGVYLMVVICPSGNYVVLPFFVTIGYPSEQKTFKVTTPAHKYSIKRLAHYNYKSLVSSMMKCSSTSKKTVLSEE